MRICARCRHENPDDAEHCLHCAAALGVLCATCGQPAPAGNRFCGYCGARLPESPAEVEARTARQAETLQSLRALMPGSLAQKITQAAPSLRGERRDVTVLCVEVGLYTPGAALDSEDVYLFVDEVMRLFTDIIYKYEGTLDRFTGEGLLALFGAPVAHENDPERAVRAALEMLAVLEPLRASVQRRQGVHYDARIGVHTGPVVAGPLAADLRLDYTVVGDTVSRAARLQAAAEPGTILVSGETYQRTRPLFRYKPLAAVRPPGAAEALEAAQPLAVLPRPGRVRGLGGVPVAMVGRQADLARLQAALQAVQQRRQSHVVLITGEAGLGKSRLVVELRRALAEAGPEDGRPPAARVYEGSCLAYARSRPLWVVADLLRSILGMADTDPAGLQREALRAYLGYLGLPADDVLPYLAHLLALPHADPEVELRLQLLEADMLQRQVHAALRQVLVAEAQRAPAVLVFEDLHWLDAASQDCLEYLVQTTSDAPLLFILIARDTEHNSGLESLVAAARRRPERFDHIGLQPLSPEEGRRLTDQLLGQPAPEAFGALEDRIAARADGNPFFIEELVRMLIEQGGLRRTGETWHVPPQVDEVMQAVPGTLKGLILARCDRLPEGPRRRLQKAAVIGRTFPAGLLPMLDDDSPAAADLEILAAGQFLVPQPFGSEAGYAFRHALVQEAVYGTLLKRDLQAIHEQVARAIERTAFWPPDEQVEVLAYHYAESRSPLRAVPYLIAAADNAARRYANRTAIQHFRRAIRIMAEAGPGYQAELVRGRLGLGTALKFVGQYGEAAAVLAEAVRDVEAAPGERDPQRLQFLTEGLRELADVRQREGAYDTAFAHLEAALAALGANAASAYPNLWRPLMDRMAWIRFRQGRLDEAYSLASAATVGVDPVHTDDPIALASLFNTLGGVCWQQGRLADATTYVQRSLRLYESLGYSFGMANAYTNLGVLYYNQSQWARAAENFERSDKLRRAIGYLPGRAANLQNLGLLRMAMGDHAQARVDLETSVLLSRQLGEDYDRVHAEIGLGQLAFLQGRLDDAAEHIQAALAGHAAAGDDEMVQAGWNWALILAERGDLPAGLAAAEQALKTAREAGLVESEADCLRVVGLLLARAGRAAEAERHLRESAAVSVKHGDRYRQGLALLELARAALRAPLADGQGAEAARQAASLFEGLGARYDLEQARAVLAQLDAQPLAPVTPALAQAAGARAAPTGEWHPAAVVWVEVEPPPGLDAEALFEALAGVLPRLMETAEAHHGHLIRRASGLTVVFGAQVAREDDAVRAVQAAHEMAQRAGAPAEPGAVAVRLAVSLGSVVAGRVGGRAQSEFMVTGEPLQAAQMLAAAVPPGRVWVTSPVRNATHHQFVFAPLPEPGVWELAGPREHPLPARGLPGVQLHLVGRETPLEAMAALAQNLSQGQGGLIWIEGEAGIGKSRLMREFAETAAELGAQVWAGQCTVLTSGHAFSLMSDLFGRLFNLRGGDSPEKIRAQLEAAIAGWPAEATAARPYLELLAGVPPSGPEGERLASLPPDQLRQQLYVALRGVFKSLAAVQPLIVLLDDLHWVDPLSADLLLFLSNLIGTVPVLFVCALRWDEADVPDDRPIKVQGLMRPGQVLRLHLDRLSDAEAEELLCGLLGDDDLPAALRDFVLRRTEGNPFYIEEVVRSLIEQEYLYRRDGRWQIDLSVNLHELPLPVSLGALIQSRVDTLPPDLKHILQCAAVIGGVFDENLLSAVSEAANVAGAVTRLEARGMLRRTAKMHQWQFNHSLIETAVYGALLKVRRQALHLKVAAALEAAWGAAASAHAAELAYHLAQANAGDRALPYLALAGEQAASRYANEEALAYFQQAQQLLAQHSDAAAGDTLAWRIAVGLGDVYRFVGDYAASHAALEAALPALHQPGLGPVHRAGLYRRLSETAQKRGEFEAALRYLNTALGHLGLPPEAVPANGVAAEVEAEAGRCLAGLALIHMRQGRLDQARQACEASAAYATRAGSLSDLAAVENLLGGIYYQLSDYEQASAHTRRAMTLREQMGHTWGVAATSSNLGILATLAGDWPEARAIFERSLALRQDLGDVEGVAIVSNNLGSLARDQGDLARAEELFRSSLEVARPLQMAYHSANASTNLADVLLLRGDLAAAEAALAGSLPAAEAIQAQDLLCENYRILAGLHLARGQWAEARQAAQRSAALAAELGDRTLESAAWRVVCEAAGQQGDWPAAHEAIARAQQAIEGVTSQLEAGRVAAQHGWVCQAQGQPDEARASLLAARDVFARLGARLDLARVEAALAALRPAPWAAS